MESNSNQYTWTPPQCLILHTIWLFCICWWDCIAWMFKESYLDYTALIMIICPCHLTARRLHALKPASYGPPDSVGTGISSTSWCSVGSSSHGGFSFGPLQWASGDHSLCDHNHWVQCVIAMCVGLCFAQVGQSMQRTASAHWIPRTSQLLLYDLLLWDSGLSHPLWVLLEPQRDLPNLGIWAGLCALIIAHFHRHVENIQMIHKTLCEPPLQMINMAWQRTK